MLGKKHASPESPKWYRGDNGVVKLGRKEVYGLGNGGKRRR